MDQRTEVINKTKTHFASILALNAFNHYEDGKLFTFLKTK
jgi:hypothetical protein